jgi:type IV pilus biogenesis/stability protein PilW
MSLILDALKRAQEAKLENAELPLPFPQGRDISSQRRFPQRILIMISAIGGVIILILALFLIISPRVFKAIERDKPADTDGFALRYKTNLQPLESSNTTKVEQPPTVAIVRQDSTEKNTDEQIALPSKGLAKTPQFSTSERSEPKDEVVGERSEQADEDTPQLSKKPLQNRRRTYYNQQINFKENSYTADFEEEQAEVASLAKQTVENPSSEENSMKAKTPEKIEEVPSEAESETASSDNNGQSPKNAPPLLKGAGGIEVETIPAKETEDPVKQHPATQDFVESSDNKDEISPFIKGGREDYSSTDNTAENATPTIKETSNQSSYHFKLGLYYQKQKKLAEAVEEYLKAIEIDPLNAEAHNNLGLAYKDMGELNKAAEEYQKVLAIEPKYEKAYNNLGVLFHLKGDLETAIQQFQKALSINPKNLAAYTNIGIIYKKQKRFEESINVFQKALAIDAHSPETHYNLALVYEESGRKEEAILHYQKFIQFSAGKYEALAEKVKNRLKVAY